MAPDAGVGIVALTNGSAAAFIWMDTEFKRLLRDLLGVPDEVVRTDIPHHPEIWGQLCGRYLPPARISDVRQRLMMPGGVEVLVHGGRLMIRALAPIPALYRGLPLHPDDNVDPYVMRLDLSALGMSTVRIVFGRNASGAATAIHAAGRPAAVAHPSIRAQAAAGGGAP